MNRKLAKKWLTWAKNYNTLYSGGDIECSKEDFEMLIGAVKFQLTPWWKRIFLA